MLYLVLIIITFYTLILVLMFLILFQIIIAKTPFFYYGQLSISYYTI